MSIKVMSQNVMCWEQETVGTFAKRRPLLKKAVREHGADIIGLQEVTPTWKQYFDEDLADYEHILVYRSPESQEATPIYWNPKKVTAKDSGHFWLSETPDIPSLGWDARHIRITCWVLFEEIATGKCFAFVNTHLDHRGETARQKGIAQICSFIREKFGADMPLILTGDFNATPDSAPITTADSLLPDARKAAAITTDDITYHGFKKQGGCIIDYIYLSQNITCRHFEIVKETDGPSIQSDHYGLLAGVSV